MAEVEEPLDLRAETADGLDLTQLVHAAGHRNPLIDADVGERRQNREELARRRAVAVDLAVALLERDLRAQAERALLAEHPAKVAAEDGDPLRVDGAAELGFSLDIDDPLSTERDDRRDPHRLPELVVAGAEDRQAVHDADPVAARIERDLAA